MWYAVVQYTIFLLMETNQSSKFEILDISEIPLAIYWNSFRYRISAIERYFEFNPNWYELRKQEKCSSLASSRCKFYKTQWAWHGVKLARLMSIFTPKKVWKFLLEIQLTKSDPKKTKDGNWPSSCQLGLWVFS